MEPFPGPWAKEFDEMRQKVISAEARLATQTIINERLVAKLESKSKCCGDCGVDRSERYRSDNVILVEALLVSKGLTDDDGVLGAIYRAIADGYALTKEEEPK